MKIARGKPVKYGQEIVKRRFRITSNRINLNGKKILDFGCGNGVQTIEIAKTSATIIAVDIDYNDIQTFKEHISLNNINNITAIKYDGKILPIKSNSIDLVLSYEVLEHVHSESDSLQELYRVLKQGGEILISVPNKWWLFETHGAYLPILPWNRVPFFSWLPHSIHSKFAKARIYKKKEIVKLLLANGFLIKNCAYITAPLDVIKNKNLKKILRKLMFRGDETRCAFLSTAILVHGQK